MTMNRANLTLWLERLSMFAVILSVAVIILLTVQSLDKASYPARWRRRRIGMVLCGGIRDPARSHPGPGPVTQGRRLLRFQFLRGD